MTRALGGAGRGAPISLGGAGRGALVSAPQRPCQPWCSPLLGGLTVSLVVLFVLPLLDSSLLLALEGVCTVLSLQM